MSSLNYKQVPGVDLPPCPFNTEMEEYRRSVREWQRSIKLATYDFSRAMETWHWDIIRFKKAGEVEYSFTNIYQP